MGQQKINSKMVDLNLPMSIIMSNVEVLDNQLKSREAISNYRLFSRESLSNIETQVKKVKG